MIYDLNGRRCALFPDQKMTDKKLSASYATNVMNVSYLNITWIKITLSGDHNFKFSIIAKNESVTNQIITKYRQIFILLILERNERVSTPSTESVQQYGFL